MINELNELKSNTRTVTRMNTDNWVYGAFSKKNAEDNFFT